MSGVENELIFDPNVLYFEPPYNAVKKDVLVIQNTTANKFVFKIKTTSPKVYCVKPNCGFIGPAGTEFDTVEVSLLFNSTDASSVAGKKDKFLVEWITMLDTDTQSDAKSLWSAVAADRPIQQHKIIAYVGRRPDDDPNAPQHASAIRNNKRRVPSKLASSLTVPDAAEFNDTHLNDSSTTASAAAAAATTTTAAAAAAPVVVTSNVSPTSIVVTPSSTTSSSAASEQTPVTQFTTPKASNSADDADIKQLQLQLSQVMQERDKLAAQLAAAQRALTAASSAAANAASAGSKSSSSSSALANPVPAPDQGIAKHLYLIALLMVVFAFLFGRFSVATNAWFAAGNNNSTA